MSNKQEAKEALAVLLRHSNIMAPGYNLGELMAELVKKEHRTIQQTFISQLHNCIVEYSDSSFDLRNEASIDFAKKVKELEIHFPFV